MPLTITLPVQLKIMSNASTKLSSMREASAAIAWDSIESTLRANLRADERVAVEGRVVTDAFFPVRPAVAATGFAAGFTGGFNMGLTAAFTTGLPGRALCNFPAREAAIIMSKV